MTAIVHQLAKNGWIGEAMSECSLCGEYSEDLHPVDFKADRNDTKCPEEIKEYLGIGSYIDDLDASRAADEFWENCARICHKCFNKYFKWIVWWG